MELETNGTNGAQDQAFVSILECSICLSLLCEPISLTCGHTFCRVCLVKSLRRHKKQCPGCREICHISAENAAENIVIKSLAIALDPVLYRLRVEESQVEKEAWTSVYPVFLYNSVMLPCEKLNLHLYEPRYKVMMNRVVNSNRTFAYISVSSRIVPGAIALVAQVKEAEFMPDGRCIVEATLCKRSTVVEHYVEDGTHGLNYCRLEPLSDEPTAPEQAEALSTLKIRSLALVEDILSDEHVRRMVDNRCGPLPSDTETFSMWLCLVSPLTESDRTIALHTRVTADRITLCIQRLEEYLENRRNPRSFPIVSALGSSLASIASVFMRGGGAGEPGPARPSSTQQQQQPLARREEISGDDDEDDDSIPDLVSESSGAMDSDDQDDQDDQEEEEREEEEEDSDPEMISPSH